MPVSLSKPRTWPLSIYLSKTGAKPESCIISKPGMKQTQIGRGRGSVGKLYTFRSKERPPKWIKFFEEHINPQEFKSSSFSAVLLIKIEKRVCAVVFGYGRHLLAISNFEEDFGIITTLNAAELDAVRSVDRITLDAAGRHGRQQTSSVATLDDFEIDHDQDILRNIVARPENVVLGSRIGGSDSLSVSVTTGIGRIKSLCRIYSELYERNDYRDRYPWIDNVHPVKSPELIAQLDAGMVTKLLDEQYDKIWMAIPTVLDWARVGGFAYSPAESATVYSDLSTEDFLAHVRASTSITPDYLKRKKIFSFDENGQNPIDAWQAYRCIYCELSLNDSIYLLNSGKWCKVEDDFVRSIDNFVKSIPLNKTIDLPAYNDDSEGDYNLRVSQEIDDLVLMDEDHIFHGGGQSKIEFCDLYALDGTICHVKRYSGSSTLSHHFQQGLVSATLMLSDSDFRSKVNAKLPDEYRFPDPDQDPDPREYEVAYAIVTTKTKRTDLPLFSKISLQATVRQLRLFQLGVSLTLVAVDSE